jgi:hypothetical protein
MEEKDLTVSSPEKKQDRQEKSQKKTLLITNRVKQLRVIIYTDNSGKEATIRFSDSVEVTESKDLLSKLDMLVRKSKVTYKNV